MVQAIYYAPYKTPDDLRSQVEAMQVLLSVITTHTDDRVATTIAEVVLDRLNDMHTDINGITFRGWPEQ